MIAELTAAMTAIREIAQIAKLMNEAKTQAEVNAAIGELKLKACVYSARMRVSR